MKIFTWMHRKLHTNVDYCMVSREKDSFTDGGKKSSTLLKFEKDTEALLHEHDHTIHVDVLDGILAIGTLGLDQVTPSPFQEEYSVEEGEYSIQDGEEEVEENEEVSPLIVEAFKDELEKALGPNTHKPNNVESEVLKSQQLNGGGVDNPLRRFLEVTELGGDDLEERNKKKGERTTLADLFFADAAIFASEKTSIPNGVSVSIETEKKEVHHKKSVRSLAKKLMPWKGEDSRQPAKLNRMIQKMLKKKIHPEVERKTHDGIGVNEISKIKPTFGQNGGNESVSLLQGVALEL